MVKKITHKNFKPYGRIIEYGQKTSQNRKKNLFRIVLKETNPVGWRIAYLVVRDKAVNCLEAHLDTYESFEPVSGKSLLYVARVKNPTKIDCFLLNRSVILNKGIWHAIAALSNESEVKITENAQVKCSYWYLPFTLPK